MGSFGQTILPSAPFADFNVHPTGSFGGSSSSVSQNSTFAPSSFSSSGAASVFVATGAYGDGAYAAHAQAISTFGLSFSLQQPFNTILSGYQDIEALGGSISFQLSSANHGVIFSSFTENTYNNNQVNFIGVLQPGDYTLEVQEQFDFAKFSPGYDSGSMNYNVAMNVIAVTDAPEPRFIGPFLALIWFGFAAVKRKLAKA